MIFDQGREWKKIGVVGVDSGCILLSDPCYRDQKDIQDWLEVLEKTDFPTKVQLNYDMGHEGAGVIVSSGLGDGCYDVEVLEGEVDGWGKRILGVRIMFIPHPVLGG